MRTVYSADEEGTMEDIRHILVVSRMTTFCRKAIHFGISLSRRYGADLSVLHAMYNPFTKGWNLPMISMEDEYKKGLEKEKKELDAIIREGKTKGLHITEHVVYGEPMSEILNTAKAERIDLIVLHAHRLSHLDHLIYGYDYEEVVKKVPCSVFLIK